MELFLQFVSENWHLFALLSGLVALLVYTENRKAGPSLSTQQFTMLVNRQNALVVDIRPVKEFKTGHIVDAVNIPFDSFEKRKTELEKHKSRPIVLVCKFGQHSGSPAKALRAAGYNVSRLRGGISEWAASKLPLVR